MITVPEGMSLFEALNRIEGLGSIGEEEKVRRLYPPPDEVSGMGAYINKMPKDADFDGLGGGVAKLPLRRTFQSGGTNFGDMGQSSAYEGRHKYVVTDSAGTAYAVVIGRPMLLKPGYSVRPMKAGETFPGLTSAHRTRIGVSQVNAKPVYDEPEEMVPVSEGEAEGTDGFGDDDGGGMF